MLAVVYIGEYNIDTRYPKDACNRRCIVGTEFWMTLDEEYFEYLDANFYGPDDGTGMPTLFPNSGNNFTSVTFDVAVTCNYEDVLLDPDKGYRDVGGSNGYGSGIT